MGEVLKVATTLDEASDTLLTAAKFVTPERPSPNSGRPTEHVKALGIAWGKAVEGSWELFEKENPRVVRIARAMADAATHGNGDRLVATHEVATFPVPSGVPCLDAVSAMVGAAPLWTFYLDRAREALDLVEASEYLGAVSADDEADAVAQSGPTA